MAKKDKRKSREDIDKDKINILKPVDPMIFGTADDPCFGKHHSLKAEECLVCGDSEFCSIVMAQNLHKDRLQVESNQEMKDLDEAEEDSIEKAKEAKEYMKGLMKRKIKKMKIILKAAEKYKLTKERTKELYNQI